MKEIVIKLSDVMYERLIESKGLSTCAFMSFAEAVKNGTELPKGHGELKDATKIEEALDLVHPNNKLAEALKREESALKALEDVRAEIEDIDGITEIGAQILDEVLGIINRKIAVVKGDKPFRYAKEVIEAQSPPSEGVNGEEFEKWLREGDKP